MNQQQPFPDGSPMAQDGQQYQQQPQWQPQQQPISGTPMHQPQPQPQYVQMPAENAAMPMGREDASTPQLDAMYSQGDHQQQRQPTQPDHQGYGQQDFAQQPQAFHDSNNNGGGMQQAPQGFLQQNPAQQYHQQPQFDPSMNPGAHTGQFAQEQPYQQQNAPPAGYQHVQDGGQPAWSSSQPANISNVAPGADASAWEQAHVTEVNNRPPPLTSQQQQQNQAIREAELHNARQRILALEAEREQQEVAQALAASARDAPDFADIEEQLQQQIHQAQLLSLDAWEQEIRSHIQEHQRGGSSHSGVAYDGGGDSWQQQPLAPPSHLGSNFSDPRGGAALYGPAPTMQNQQNDFSQPQQPFAPGGPGQMAPPMNLQAQGSNANLGFRSPTPRSQTPTRGVPLSDAARNAAAEEAQRWEAYHRGLNAQDGASVSAGTEYTINPTYSEASTALGGSKGKGRMS